MSDELALAEEVNSFALDPLGFVLYAFPWGVEGTELADSSGPRRWQRDVLQSLGDRLAAGYDPGQVLMPVLQAISSGHGIGKSALVSMLVCWAMSTCVDTKVVVTANTEPQLRTKTFPEISKWFRLLICSHWFRVNGMAIHATLPGHDKTWRTDAVTWSDTNLEAFAGLHNKGRRILLIFDEASGIINRVWEVAEGALTDEGTEILWLAFGNPTQPSGVFFECFNRQRHRWHGRKIDSRTVEGTNLKLFEQWAETYGEDSNFMRVRVRGEFPRQGSMQFIGTEDARAAISREVAVSLADPLVMGVDVARYGDDRSVIFFRRGRDARMLPPLSFRRMDTMQLAARVVDEARRHGAEAVFIDGGGMGAGVVDRCRQLGLPGLFEVQFGGKADRVAPELDGTRYANKRAEMWGLMRAWLKDGALPKEDELVTDLTGPTYFFNARNEIALEKKEDMKRRGFSSPDMADALALTFAYPVVGKAFAGQANGGGQVVADYELWE